MMIIKHLLILQMTLIYINQMRIGIIQLSGLFILHIEHFLTFIKEANNQIHLTVKSVTFFAKSRKKIAPFYVK